MRVRLAAVVALVAAVAIAVPLALIGGGGGEATRRRPSPSTTSTTSVPSATTAPPNLAAAAVRLTPVAELTDATAMAARQGDPTLYVAQQQGRVVAIRDGSLDPTPVLDISSRTPSGGEQGLLGMAFSPDGTKLYVHSTAQTGATRLEEYAFADGRADAASARLLLTVAQPQSNHNGGELTFGPDGYLYLALGDGGAGGDQGAGHAPGGNGQSLDTLLGKILRIDPTPSGGRPYTIPSDNPFASAGGRPEIWAYGLRNPWRATFDAETGDLWIADVGQNEWEEIDYMPVGRGAGANYGWNVFEGAHRFRAGNAPGAVAPILEVSHDEGYCAITGGYVYRGTSIHDLVGAYLYTDYCNGDIRALVQQGGEVVASRSLGIAADDVSSFGQDAAGELYVLSQSDGVFRIDP